MEKSISSFTRQLDRLLKQVLQHAQNQSGKCGDQRDKQCQPPPEGQDSPQRRNTEAAPRNQPEAGDIFLHEQLFL